VRVCNESTAVFDEANLVSCAGLVPVLTLAERAGLHDLAAEHLTLAGPGAANAPLKVTSLVAGMIAGADSIEDMDVLRHGAQLGNVRCPVLVVQGAVDPDWVSPQAEGEAIVAALQPGLGRLEMVCGGGTTRTSSTPRR